MDFQCTPKEIVFFLDKGNFWQLKIKIKIPITFIEMKLVNFGQYTYDLLKKTYEVPQGVAHHNPLANLNHITTCRN